MKLLRFFRKHGTAAHGLLASTYRFRGWTYTDRSCLPPKITDPDGKESSEDACLEALILPQTTDKPSTK